MSKQLYKKFVIPTVMATLLLSSATASAYTGNHTSYNQRFVFNVRTTQQLSQNGTNYRFRFPALGFNLQNFNRVTMNNNTAAPQVEAEKNTQPTEYVAPSTQSPVPQPTPQPAPQPTPQTAPQPTPQTAPNANVGNTSNARHALTQSEIQLVEYVNQARREAGLAALSIDVDLSYVARVKSQDMHDNQYFSHTSPTYGSPFDMMRSFGINYRAAAENIARTSSVQAAHNGFMNSEGHRKNIMNPNLTHIGIGIYNGYYTQMFISK